MSGLVGIEEDATSAGGKHDPCAGLQRVEPSGPVLLVQLVLESLPL